jgi:hypothetical protein
LPKQGARFEVHFEKTRGFHGQEARPFEARYEMRNGAAVDAQTEVEQAREERCFQERSFRFYLKSADFMGLYGA